MAVNLRFQVRRRTADAWEEDNTVLLAGEVALDTTHRKLKVGDGTTAWKDLPFVTPEVVNALLETNSVYDALSAHQGWLLKKDVTDINTTISKLEQNITLAINNSKVKVVNELKSTNSVTDALSAAQGWVLKQAIDGKTSVGLVNDLTTGGTDKALTAEQGKVLNGKIPTIANDVLVDPSPGYANMNVPKASQVNWLYRNSVLLTDLARNLTTDSNDTWGARKVLAADQGPVIKAYIDNLQAQINNLSSSGGSGTTAATIRVGSTNTGAAGSQAKVENVGTPTAVVLNFTIPRGAKGDTGNTGPQGPQGAKGADAVVLNSWSTSATAALSAAKGYELNEKIKNVSTLSTETWTFTLSNGSTVPKTVVLSS